MQNEDVRRRQARFREALHAALHDSHIEKTHGTKLIFFFDADVIVGSLYATKFLDKNATHQLPTPRHIVRRLWLAEELPRVRLTVPHLIELQSVIRQIGDSGGLSSYWQAERRAISETLGLGSLSKWLDELAACFGTKDDEQKVRAVVEKLGMKEISSLESELTSRGIHPPGVLKRNLALEEDLGPTPEDIERDDRYQSVLGALQRIRPSATKQNNSDAAALLALSSLWARDDDSGVDYRFYTQTEAIRKYCEESGRPLAMKPHHPAPPSDLPCVNYPHSFMRSSLYFMLRTTFDSIGFSPNVQTDTECAGAQSRITEQGLDAERSLLQGAVDTLALASNQDLHQQSSAADVARSIRLLLERVFLEKLLSKRRVLILRSLRDLPVIDELRKTIEGLRPRLLSHLGADQQHSRAIVDRAVSLTYLRKHIADSDTPSVEELRESVRRWGGLFLSKDDENHVNNALFILSTGDRKNQTQASKWLDGAIETFHRGQSVDDAIGVMLPLLILGQHNDTTDYLNRLSRPPEDPRSRLALFAIRMWCRTLMPSDAPDYCDRIKHFWDKIVEISDGIIWRAARTSDKGTATKLSCAWLAVYASCGLLRCAASTDITSDLSKIVKRGLDWINELRRLNAPLAQEKSLRICELILMANRLIGIRHGEEHRRLAAELATILQRAADSDPLSCVESPKQRRRTEIYATSALFWATFASRPSGGEGDVEFARSLPWFSSDNPAFERFQHDCLEEMRPWETRVRGTGTG